MSLFNPYAFTPFGQPATPGVSALRAIGAPASAAQLYAAQSVFRTFCAQTQLSAAPNQTAIGRLPDGTQYKITVVGAMTTMTVWPEGVPTKEVLGGIVVFYRGIGFVRVWWQDKEKEWEAAKVDSAFCGSNVQRAADGTYFCDNLATVRTEDFSTKLDGKVRSRPLPFGDGTSIQGEGYLLACEDMGGFNFMLPSDAGATYMRVSGPQYEVLTSGVIPSPSPTPSLLKEVVAVGTLAGSGMGSPQPEYARRADSKFLLAAASLEDTEADPALLWTDWALVADSVRLAFRGDFSPTPKKDVRFFTIDSAPPYSVSSEQKPILSDVSRTFSVGVERAITEVTITGERVIENTIAAPTDGGTSTVYAGFPVTYRLVTGVYFNTKDGYTKRIRWGNKETRWVRECVSYGGERYSAYVSANMSLKRENKYTSTQFNNYIGTGYPEGSWQSFTVGPLPGGIDPLASTRSLVPSGTGVSSAPAPTWDREEEESRVFTHKLTTFFVADDFSVPLLDVGLEIQLKVARKVKYSVVNGSTVVVEEGGPSQSAVGTVAIRTVLGYEEKTFTTVVSEDKYSGFAISRPHANVDRYVITATRTSRVCVFRRGVEVHSSIEKSAPFTASFFPEDVPFRVPLETVGQVHGPDTGTVGMVYRTRLPSGWVSTGPSTGYWTVPGVITGAALPVILPQSPVVIATKYGGTWASTDPGEAPGAGQMLRVFDYPGMYSVLPRPKVKFAVDPIGGGCAVISQDMNLLISPSGQVRQLADITMAADAVLDPWCASI